MLCFIEWWRKVCERYLLWVGVVLLTTKYIAEYLFICIRLFFHDLHHFCHHQAVECNHALGKYGSNIGTM